MLTRVPLTVRAPFVPNAAKGRTVRELVQLFDIVATTLELADIESKHVHFAQTLVPYLSADAPPAAFAPRAVVFAEGGYATNEPRDHEGYVDGLPGTSRRGGDGVGRDLEGAGWLSNWKMETARRSCVLLAAGVGP